MSNEANARAKAVGRLLDYIDIENENEEIFTTLVSGFLLKTIKHRLKDGAKEVGALQAERLVRRPLTIYFTKAPDVKHFEIGQAIKKELRCPVNWLISALDSSGDNRLKVLGTFLEGAKILLEKATFIGRAASIAFFVYDAVEDALEFQEKKQNERLALEHDAAFLKLSIPLGRCVTALENEAKQCLDSKAYVRHSSPHLLDHIKGGLWAASWAQGECGDVETQKEVARAAFRLYQTCTWHRNAISFINEQLVQVVLVRVLARALADLAQRLADDPESIPTGRLPTPPYRYEDRVEWIEKREKMLNGYCKRLRALDTPLSKATDSLQGEMFLAPFLMGLAAKVQQVDVQDAKRGRRTKGLQH